MNKIFLFVLVALLLLGGLFILVRPESLGAPTSVKEFSLVVENNKLVSGPETLVVKEGDDVTIVITSDSAEELHLHGYGKSVELEAGVPTTLSFKATLSGRFVYELEKSKIEIGVLEVLP